MEETLIKNNLSTLDDNKKEVSLQALENIPILIKTIDDLINVINLKIDLTNQEKECIQIIKNNINGIKACI